MSYDDDIDEEMTIAQEQDSEDSVLHAEVFKKEINELELPPPICVEEGTILIDAINLMKSKRIGSVLVTRDGKLSGILTERDVLMEIVGDADLETEKVGAYMTPDPISLLKTDMICFVLHNMHIGGFRHVPIVDGDNKPISMVSIKDVVGFILAYFPTEIDNILSEPYRGESKRDSA